MSRDTSKTLRVFFVVVLLVVWGLVRPQFSAILKAVTNH